MSITKTQTVRFVRQGIQGDAGADAVVYKLLPSTTAISFTRDSDGKLTPNSYTVYCGYTKTVGDVITTVVGTDGTTLEHIDGEYQIFYRCWQADGTATAWGWSKDTPSFVISSSTTYIGVEWMMAHNIPDNTLANLTDDCITDRVVVPITKDGATGNGVASVTEYYARSTSSTEVTGDWSTDVPTLTSTYKYLWNYEEVTYTDGTSSPTEPALIGVYGNDGKGIASVTEYYARSTSNATAPDTSEFSSTNFPTLTNEYKYLWNYEVITYTDNSTPTTTDPVIIGVYGDKGDKGDDGTSVTIKGTKASEAEVRAVTDPTAGDGYLVDGYLWVYGEDGEWSNVGQIQGPAGTSAYVHIAYADDTSGTNLSTTATGHAYIGVYAGTKSSQSDVLVSEYVWSRLTSDIYTLKCSPTVLHYDANGNRLTTSIEINITKYNGETQTTFTEMPEEVYIEVFDTSGESQLTVFNADTDNGLPYTLTLSDDWTIDHIDLCNATTDEVLSRDYITAVNDGEKGDTGDDAVVYTLDCSTNELHYNSKGVLTNSEITINVIKWSGGEQEVLTEIEGTMAICGFNASSTEPIWTLMFGTELPATVDLSEYTSMTDHICLCTDPTGATALATASLTAVNDGKRGPTLRGPQYWEDVADDYEFQAGGEDDTFLDVVIYNGVYYYCNTTHTKESDTEDEDGNTVSGNWPGSDSADYYDLWNQGSSFDLVATKILLATYALVKNLGVETVEIAGGSGSIVMKDSNGNVMFEVKNGNVTCNTGTFNDIIVAGSSLLAGFRVNGDALINYDSEDDDTRGTAYIDIRNLAYGLRTTIGTAIINDEIYSNTWCAGAFYSTSATSTANAGTKRAVYISAKNAENDDNRAIEIGGGTVSGVAMKNTYISTGDTSVELDRLDYNIIACNTVACTITLPSMEMYDEGHVIRIKRLGTGKLYIAMQDCVTTFGSGTPVLIYGENNTLTGTDTLDVGNICNAMELVWCEDINRTVNGTTYHGAWVQYLLPCS